MDGRALGACDASGAIDASAGALDTIGGGASLVVVVGDVAGCVLWVAKKKIAAPPQSASSATMIGAIDRGFGTPAGCECDVSDVVGSALP